MKAALSVLIAFVMAASIGIAPLYNQFVKPQILAFQIADKEALAGTGLGIWLQKVDAAVYGGFASILFFAVILVLMVAIPIIANRIKPSRLKSPYLCGANADEDLRGLEFISPGDKVETVVVRNYYMQNVFGENKLTFWVNVVAGAVIIIMLGVVIGL
jgi:ech hydrogenase subunit A